MLSSRFLLLVPLVATVGQLQPVPPSPSIDPDFNQLVAERKARLATDDERRAAIAATCEFASASTPCLLPSETPPADIDPRRSLFVHDNATLSAADFSLRRTLTQIASQVTTVVPSTTTLSTFRQFFDTQNPAGQGVTSGPHCDDNDGRLNGFPTHCSTALGKQAQGTDAEVDARIDQFSVLGLVNRLDLAHQGWRNCGEYRIIYGRFEGAAPTCPCSNACGSGGCQAYIGVIFEAVLPNPKPGCAEGCRPVAEFWKSLSGMANPSSRARRLEQFFYTGLPGFRPVVHVNHYGVPGVAPEYGGSGTGQIRTTYYSQREFKTVIDCGATPCRFLIVPIPVKNSPYSLLWNEDVAHRRSSYRVKAQQFQADVVAQLQSLSATAIMDIDYSVDAEHHAADGSALSLPPDATVGNDAVEFKEAAGPVATFRAALGSGSLSALQVVRRAGALSCEGCHAPTGTNAGDSIGKVTTPTQQIIAAWPAVVGVTGHHIDVLVTSLRELSGGMFGDGKGHRLSPALLNVFLPDRKTFLLRQLNAPHCPCEHRFSVLPDAAERLKARAIQDSVRASSGSRPPAEQDAILRGELERAGIRLPVVEAGDLRPGMVRFAAAQLAQGDLRREHVLRAAELMKTLGSEPPRRTVSGSFRVH
jgi:hypothetical protein